MGFIGSLLLILDLNSCGNADLALEEAHGIYRFIATDSRLQLLQKR